jgi:glycosyltransferase involved in cell wall biosynthesis
LRILFLSHTGARSGAENALLRLLQGLPREHTLVVACPSDGTLKSQLREAGIEQLDLAGTDLSLALHPVHTARGLLRLLHSALSLRALARRFRADLIHANTTRAGLIAIAARSLGGPPVVVQCHDHLPRNLVGRLVRTVIARGARAVVAVTDRTAAEFNWSLPRPKAERVYISVDHARFTPAVKGSSSIRAELGLPPRAHLLAQVAQITPWKGQDTAIRALAAVRRRLDAHLLIVGDIAFSSRRYDNVGFRRSLDRIAGELGVESAVHFLGERPDVPELVGAVDLLLLPSWDEPFGLVAAEAMAVGTVVLVTRNGGLGEYVTDRVNGRLLPPDDPAAWAEAATELLGDPEELTRMGTEGVRAAARFSDERYAREMLAVYERTVSVEDGVRS